MADLTLRGMVIRTVDYRDNDRILTLFTAENGGQYLNACVWFECITGKSCIGNPWRPKKYTLSEERIDLLQRAAHQAVEECLGL